MRLPHVAPKPRLSYIKVTRLSVLWRVTFPAQNVYHDGNYQYNGQCQVRRISVHDR